MDVELSQTEKKRIKTWLNNAFKAANSYDGSEKAEEAFYKPLSLLDDFVRSLNADVNSSELMQQVASSAFPDHLDEMPETVEGFLDIFEKFYTRLKSAVTSNDIFDALEMAGAVVQERDKVFVQTDHGQINAGGSEAPDKYEVRIQPRLATLVSHLRNEGANGQSIYMDDLVILAGKSDPNMVRDLPYNIVQIPRLDMEIALCDQVGEITFVKKGAAGETFWDHMSKDALKERDDIWTVRFNDEDQWWSGISHILSGNAEPDAKKVNVQKWSKNPVRRITDEERKLIEEHAERTGLGGRAIFSTIENPPEGLNKNISEKIVSGHKKKALPEHIEALKKSYEKQPDIQTEPISSEDAVFLQDEAKRTGLEGEAIFSTIENPPEGMDKVISYCIVRGDIKNARPEFIKALKQAYEKQPDKQPISSKDAAFLRDEAKRTGLEGASIFDTIENPPEGLSRTLSICIVGGDVKNARPEHIEALKHTYKQQSDKQTELISSEDAAFLQDEAKRTGLQGKAIFSTIENPPEGMNGVISYCIVRGEIKNTRPEFIKALKQAYEKQPDAEVQYESASEFESSFDHP